MKYFLAAIIAALFSATANAQPVSYGDLSYSGTGNIIEDSFNNLEWLQWDVLADLNYQQTIDAIGVGGEYEGWNIADADKAQDFTNALLSGLTNSCSVGDVGVTVCATSTSTDLPTLTGENYQNFYDITFFLSGDNGEVGILYHCTDPTCTISSVRKNNNWGVGTNPNYPEAGENISKSDLYSAGGAGSDAPISWLLYRDATPVPEVSATGSLAAFGSLLALIAFLWEQRRSSRSEDEALAA